MTLVYFFEKPGVLLDENDDTSVIPTIDKALYGQLLERGVINSGMIPKMDNAFGALDAGVGKVYITSSAAIDGQGGTLIIL